jgi:transcriptional regulator with XRE-family HTH domain
MPPPVDNLAAKISRLVQERGWNQEDFARIAKLNRHTVRQILHQAENRRLRNATVLACARALGLTVSELRTLPLDRLLPRMHGSPPEGGDDNLNRLTEMATQLELRAWVERNPDRARRLMPVEIDELLALQGDDGPLARFGVDQFVERMEKTRALITKVRVVAGSEYLGLLEQFVTLLYEKIQP